MDTLTRFMLKPEKAETDSDVPRVESDSDQRSGAPKRIPFGKRIPRKREPLPKDDKHPSHIHGWGLVVHKKFDYLTCVLIWSMISLLISTIVVIVLVSLGPLRGNVVGIFTIIFGFLAFVNCWVLTVSVTYARSEGLFK
jgi:hypothetical protein